MDSSGHDATIQLPDANSPVVIWRDGACHPPEDLQGAAVLPGAFNPVHDGHRQLRTAAVEFLGCPVLFELSIHNVDKPPLHALEVRQRVSRIADGPVLLTSAPLFADKARLFPGAWFVVGFDTAERILDPKYYAQDLCRRDQFLQDLLGDQVKFLVAGRVTGSQGADDFRTREQLAVDRQFRDMFVELPESCFRLDLSSTAIRRQRHPR